MNFSKSKSPSHNLSVQYSDQFLLVNRVSNNNKSYSFSISQRIPSKHLKTTALNPETELYIWRKRYYNNEKTDKFYTHTHTYPS
ncbi:hypothetical protein NC653_036205 [Populus alba x Populus x berolinensis]|uniref:Uncharacterized protein n=1 Tax=Populus alba x Populus x berolinensis TaxID=444605 RepID=A0AAD6LKU4_9ROSI|nr:hypothetical protein NC653_036205 [Populus alba x Populus x berolinensis]